MRDRILAQIAELSDDERAAYAAQISESELRALDYDWHYIARSKQLPPGYDRDKHPTGTFRRWLLCCGRSFGKTRCAAEWIKLKVLNSPPGTQIAIVGQTARDVRRTMISDSQSGIISVFARDPSVEQPQLNLRDAELRWKERDVTIYGFSSETPDALRGLNLSAAWCDELCKFEYLEETWQNLLPALRIGNPQIVITTTPKPSAYFKREILDHPDTIVTRGHSLENPLLPPAFRDDYERVKNTVYGRQEYAGEIIFDNAAGLWRRELFQLPAALPKLDEFDRIVVGLDPAVSSDGTSGIIVVGKLGNLGYVLADVSTSGTPEKWARAAVQAANDFNATAIIGERNQGGELIKSVIHNVDPYANVKLVHASKGKVARSEPVSQLYEQQRIYHARAFRQLEDQLCEFDPNRTRKYRDDSPDRMDALCWALTELLLGEKSFSPFYSQTDLGLFT